MTDTPKHVLGPHYILATTEEIEAAIRYLEFELAAREARGNR